MNKLKSNYSTHKSRGTQKSLQGGKSKSNDDTGSAIESIPSSIDISETEIRKQAEEADRQIELL